MNKKSSGLGVSIGLILWGCILFLFTLLTGITGGLFWILTVASLVLLLFGSMGACIELFDKKENRNA